MIPRECKRLAEVDFPIAEVSRHAAREKSIRHGLPSTLHLWWARRPLASSRAVLLALLLPDPCDENCPHSFKLIAKPLLKGVGCGDNDTDLALRAGLLKFIADFASWSLSAKHPYVEAARALVRAAYEDEAPLLVDPFAGGGSIPLEALRVGCEAFASDLNPVACLILKVMLEDVLRDGVELADDVKRAGSEILKDAKGTLADLYPADPDGATPIAYLWARTVRCEAPNCGAEIPLMRSLWVCSKASRRLAFRAVVRNDGDSVPNVALELFEPRGSGEVRRGSVTRARATCLCCGTALAPERVRVQLAAQHGGADVIFDDDGRRIGGARMTAVVTLRPGHVGRHYRHVTDADYASVYQSQRRLRQLIESWEQEGHGLCPVPDEPMPPVGTLGFRVQRYGMLQWRDLFTARQAVALSALANATASNDRAQAASLLAVGKLVDLANALCGWMPQQECPSAVFKLGRVKMSWDFVEACPLSFSSGSFAKCTSNLAAGITATSISGATCGQVIQAMAQESPLPDDCARLFFTDPPYYDAIPYADLADVFFVWMKRMWPSHPLLRDVFDPANPLCPKDQEAVQDSTKLVNGKPKDARFFDSVMAQAFAEGRRVLTHDGVGAVVFAHKTTQGWEAFLSGMIRGGWTITASWPIATEMAHRIRARDSAALATSVHLVCRPRADDASIGDWADVLRELPPRVRRTVDRLQTEGIRGADLVFACIGPALEIYSRYRVVETADGHEVGLREYLEKVWEVVGQTALRQVLVDEAGGLGDPTGELEEDARLTALFLWTLQSTEVRSGEGSDQGEDLTNGGTYTLPYDVVRRFAQPMGIDLDATTGRVIDQKKGVVHLLSLAERAKVLFGSDGAPPPELSTVGGDTGQMMLFEDDRGDVAPGTREVAVDFTPNRATTLDRIHSGMVLQAGGNAGALRSLIDEERQRGPGFLRLANALSALYPSGSQEKRVLDAMLLAVPR